MVRVYLAEIPEKEIKPKAQSEWAHRLFETALQREYPSISSPILLQKDEKGKPFLPEYPGIYMNLSHSGRYAACAIGEKPVNTFNEYSNALMALEPGQTVDVTIKRQAQEEYKEMEFNIELGGVR